MRRQLDETLDEAIDRVAAGLTSVPADSALARRHSHLAMRPAPIVSWATASTLFAILVCLVALRAGIWNEKDATQIMQFMMTAPQLSVATGASASRDVPDAGIAPVLTRQVRPAARIIAASPVAAGIPALPVPETLHVEELTLHALTILPVELGSLEVPTIEVGETSSASESKE